MDRIRINKVKELKGSVRVSGSKNAAIPILCTSLIAKKEVILKNVPKISDILKLITIIKYLNCKVKWKKNALIINSINIEYKPLTIKECSEIRGSYYLIPIMLLLFRRCVIALPGGCKIGKRPIDAHIAAFEALGYKVLFKDNVLTLEKEKDVEKFQYIMSKQSVGASINTILCSLSCSYAVIDNLVLEPEGLAVIDFLKKLGYKVDALAHKCVYKGYEPIKVKKFSFEIIPDRMEAMTFIIMGLLCGKLKIKNVNVDHLKYPLDLLIQAKYKIKKGKNFVQVFHSRRNSFNIKTDIYPLFPTDMQPLFGVLLAYSRGSCTIEETIFENRLQIYKDLFNVGASINLIDNKAYIIGGNMLRPGNFTCVDLRHAAAIMLLLLKTGGKADQIYLLQRGYDNFFNKIKSLGAKFSIN